MIDVKTTTNDGVNASGTVKNNGSAPFNWTANCKRKHWVIDLALPAGSALSKSRIEAIRARVDEELGG